MVDRVDRGQDRLHDRDVRKWVRQHERDTGQREGITTAEAARIKALERDTERLAEAGIESSVGSKGDRDDNALDETINGLYKAKVIHCHASWTQEAVELATLEWVSWFNHHRLLEPIGYVPTAEAEAHDYRSLNKQAVTG